MYLVASNITNLDFESRVEARGFQKCSQISKGRGLKRRAAAMTGSVAEYVAAVAVSQLLVVASG